MKVLKQIIIGCLFLGISLSAFQVNAMESVLISQKKDFTMEAISLSPGDQVLKTIILENDYNQSVKVYLKSIEILDGNLLARNLVIQVPSVNTLFHGEQFSQNYDSLLFGLQKGQAQSVEIAIGLAQTIGNEVQDQLARFRLVFMIVGDSEDIPDTGVASMHEWIWFTVAGAALLLIGWFKQKGEEYDA